MNSENAEAPSFNAEEAPKKPGRRRILSCNTCRRAKTRCDFNPRFASCDRCQKLRMKCSLNTESVSGRSSRTVNDESSLEERVSNIETSLSEIKNTMEKLCTFMQNLHDKSQNNSPGTTTNGHNSSQEVLQFHGMSDRLENIQFPHLLPVRSETAKSTPIMMVRKFRSKNRRLYKDSSRDIIDKQILSEDLANILVSEFVRRQGRVLQIEDSPVFTSMRSLRRKSPLLYAVCCLHGLRFCKDLNLVNTVTHRQLYEEVRDMLGQIVLASPLPIEELYAVLIMCTFEAAPKPVFEYIESWLLSGICAKQAILGIDFARIMCNMEIGKFDIEDKQLMSFWNNTCLINLRFAVGTGKPPTIPADYMKQCPAILNNPHATVEDGIVFAEILLFSTLYHKLGDFPLLDEQGQCEELTAWEDKWRHLLASPKAITLRFSHDIAYLMLARHSLEGPDIRSRAKSTINPNPGNGSSSSTIKPPKDHADEPTEVFHSIARQSALSLANKFLESPIPTVQELPKFHHICIAYCALVLSEYAGHCEISDEDLLTLLKNLQEHYYEFSCEVPPAMSIAVERVKLCIGSKGPETGLNREAFKPNLPMENEESTTSVSEPPPESTFMGVPGSEYQGDAFGSMEMQGAGMEGVMDTTYNDLGYGSRLDDLGTVGTFLDGDFMSFMDYFNNNV